MAKKVNKRSSNASNFQPNTKKDKSVKRTKNDKNVSVEKSNSKPSVLFPTFYSYDRYRLYFIAILAVLFAFCNSYHQATMFENDRHFSHLSSLEREMTFRTEMGLYYYYYKVLVETPTFQEGITRITNNNLTEYPSVINTLERFNLYPEVVLATAYRTMMNVANAFNISLKECWHVLRGSDLPPVESCVGIGVPAHFYVTSVFLLNGLVGSLMFLYGTTLSHSIFGGILSALCFFFNHGECTRVQWTPPLRESFGYPIFLLQMMLVSLTLRCQRPQSMHFVIISITNTLFILSWQFAQFALLTQILALCCLYIVNVVTSSIFKCILKGHLIALAISVVFLFGNKMLIASFYTSLLIICFIICSLEKSFYKLVSQIHPYGIKFLQCMSIALLCLLMKIVLSYILNVKDDAHIWNLLKSKFTSYKDFHTMLYTCAVEFDFMSFETVMELSKTFVLPVAVISILVAIFSVFYQKSMPLQESSELLYNILQCFFFFVMAALIMRLKLFFSPHLCLMSSLIMNERIFQILTKKEVKYCIFATLLAVMSVQGISNIKTQRNIIGEFVNPDLEELMLWINSTLPKDAVFAGPMPTMANILLSTERPIVNHPHYENADLRERTHKIYQIFSRKPVKEVYNTLENMHVKYVILERNWCFGKRKEGCAMVDLWDIEDVQNRAEENVCSKIVRSPTPFRTLFRNSMYTVLSL